jgi:spermidine synthase
VSVRFNGQGFSADGRWLTDAWADDVLWTVGVEEVLFDEQSAFQRVQVVRTSRFGRMLILDTNVQCAEADEAGYHELLVHVGLCRRGAGAGKKRVLIIGGGDGGAAREALRHQDVERVDLVDIDGMVLDVARRFLPTLWRAPGGGALDDDPRFFARAEDGLAFLERDAAGYDLVIVDGSDPVGPGAVLYADRFYDAIRRRLRPGGAVTVQAGSFWYLPEVLQLVNAGLARAFPVARVYQCFTTVYPGGLWALAVATLGDDPALVDEERAAGLEGLSFYDGAAHGAAFALPPVARRVLASPAPALEQVQAHLKDLMR